MIDIIESFPSVPGAIAVSIANGVMPVKVWYQVNTLGIPSEWALAGAVDTADTVEIPGLVPGTWYDIVAIDATGSPSRVVRTQPRGAAAPNFQVDLIRKSIEADQIVAGRTTCFRLRVEASNPTGLADAGVFLYYYDGAADPVFQAVCKPSDLETFTLNGVDAGFIRKDFIDLMENNRELLEEDWSAVLEDVRSLMDNLERNLTLDLDYVTRVTGTFDDAVYTSVPAP
jgi:hypothetical protein